MSEGIINLQTYSRPRLLERCLESIYSCEDSQNLTKLMVLQSGNKEVENLVRNYAKADPKTHVIEVSGIGKTPLQNMNWNRWVAWSKGFDEFKAPWILSLEEDVVLHKKSVKFVSEIFNQLSQDKDFRGVNLGSKLSDFRLNCTYSKLRFGLHGCGAAISLDTWEEIKNLGIKRKLNDFPLDACIEHILKDGYMVTPNLSHYLDFGWYQGTHTNSDPTNPHYLQVRESFDLNSSTCKNIRHLQVEHNWREDCISYEKSQNFKFKVRKYLSLILTTKSWTSFFIMLRNLKRLALNQPRI